jgi:sec-independent protein translocase protein TatC
MSDSRDSLLPPDDPDLDSSAELKPFLDHLEDLRWMLIKMFVTLGATMFLCFAFARHLMAVMIYPLSRVTPETQSFLRTLEVTGGFTLAMKLSLYAGLVIACPLLLFFLAQFIIPALTHRERGLLWPAFTGGAGMFLGGVMLAYFVVIPAGLRFFIDYNEYLGIRSEWTIDNYVSFVSHMMLAFGVCFELPMVILVLAKLGLVTHAFLRQKRPYVIVIIFIVAAVLTPTTDPVNQTLLAGPMCLLYEACIWIAWWMERRKASSDQASP